MSSTIAVELPPGDVASPGAQALLETCTVGTQTRARCVLSQDAGADDERIAVAIVTWDGAARTGAHVEVGLRYGGLQKWRARDMSFAREDPEVERWRTVGFAIATLAGDLIERGEDASRREAPAAPAPAAPQRAISGAPPATDSLELPPRSWLDALVSVETGAGSAPAFRGDMNFAHMLDPEHWFVAGGVHCAAQWLGADRLSIVRPGASVGIGAVVLELGRRARVTLRVEATLELVHVTGTDPATGATARADRLIPGLEEGLDGVWSASRSVGLVAGVRAAEWTGAVDIRAHGQPVARIPAVGWVGQGGVRIAFP
jgi:hypothetical protein